MYIMSVFVGCDDNFLVLRYPRSIRMLPAPSILSATLSSSASPRSCKTVIMSTTTCVVKGVLRLPRRFGCNYIYLFFL